MAVAKFMVAAEGQMYQIWYKTNRAADGKITNFVYYAGDFRGLKSGDFRVV